MSELINRRLAMNEPPGTIEYSGNYKNEPFKVEIYRYDKDKFTRDSIESLDHLEIGPGVNWINITGLNDTNSIKEIGQMFNINNMVLEDIVQVSHRTKIQSFDDHIFSIFKMIYLKKGTVAHEHVSVYYKDNIVITFQEMEGDVFDSIRDRIENDKGSVRRMGSIYLFYIIMDALVDNYYGVMRFLGEKIDILEEDVLDLSSSDFEVIYKLRKQLLLLKNAVFPLKESLLQFTSRNNIFLDENIKIFYYDINDHLNHLTDSITLYREILTGISDTYNAYIGNDMNRVMTTLTIFSAVFIPLSFLAGVFGMNFTYIPGLQDPSGFIKFAVVSLVIFGVMIGYFKSRKWF